MTNLDNDEKGAELRRSIMKKGRSLNREVGGASKQNVLKRFLKKGRGLTGKWAEPGFESVRELRKKGRGLERKEGGANTHKFRKNEEKGRSLRGRGLS